MADPKIASAPQTFTFGGKPYSGQLEGFSGRSDRRFALHEFLKRAGGRVEDMERAPRKLDVRLVFIGDDCAKQYEDFAKFVDENPYGLLVHPTAGKFNAFCQGPSEDVNFGTATNLVSVRVTFVESNVDAAEIPADIPSAPAAAQLTTVKLSAFEQGVATYMGAIAQGYVKLASATVAIQDALANVALVTEPIALVRAAVSTAVGATSAAVGAIVSIQTQSELLAQDVRDFVLSTADIFDGTDGGTSSDGVDLLLGTAVAQGEAAVEAFLAAALSPAGAAEVVGVAEELVASCYVLREALAQARPPVIDYTVQRTVDLVTLCVQLYPDSSATAQASIVLGLNRIKNPAAIAAGTVLRVPSR